MVAVGGGVQAYLAHDADGGAIDALEEIVVIRQGGRADGARHPPERLADRPTALRGEPTLMSPALIAAAAAVVVVPIVIAVILKVLYKVPAADQALIVTGGGTKGQTAGTEGRTYKIVTGGGALVIPVLQKAQYLSMKADKAILDVEGVDSQKIPVGVRGAACPSRT